MDKERKASPEYTKIRACYELAGYEVIGDELTWDQVDRWFLDFVFNRVDETKDGIGLYTVYEFWRNLYSLCITAVRLGINEFDDWDQ